MTKFQLKNKTILIVSPQKWGDMHISKHHYAIELAARGNKVYFVNPPENKSNSIEINPHNKYNNLFIVSYGFLLLNQLKFRLPKIYDKKVKQNLNKIIKNINDKLDIFWTFDLRIGNIFAHKQSFIKIAHPVDFTKQHEIENVKGADLILSVAQGILNDFKKINIPSYFVNHGVSESFINKFQFDYKENPKNNRLKFGYIGNLLRFDIDHHNIIRIIEENPTTDFIFYGNYAPSNISGSFTENSKNFIDNLKALDNAYLKGVFHPKDLAIEIKSFDGFFLCYDKDKDVCKGTNYHKVMEYLSTGKVVISNHVETYADLNLVQMPNKEDDNSELLNIFKNVIINIDEYNSKSRFEKRRNYAKDNSYIKQVNRIENIIGSLM